MDAGRRGVQLDLSTGDPTVDDPAHGADWPATRTVRADVVAQLVTGELTPDSRRLRTLRLKGAHLKGELDLEAAELVYHLELENCSFEKPINLNEAQAAAIRLPGCHLTGITADGLHTRSDLTLRNVDTVNAEVSLIGAHIGGLLNLSGASLTNPDGYALHADGLQVDQGMFCRGGFTARGEVRLLGAHIGGQLDLTGASLTNPDGTALNASGLQVDQSMLCRDGFTTQGEVSLLSAHIGSQLNFIGANLTNPDGLALDLERATANSLLLLPQERLEGVVDLTNARVGSFLDHPAGWPAEMRLRGFTYEVLENVSIGVRTRLRWLGLNQEGYAPGVFDQLATAYRRTGHVEDARRVAIAKQRRRRRELNPWGWLWNLFLQVTVGYGYRPWLAGIWLAGLLATGAVVFAGAHPEQFHQASATVHDFQPVVYTLDVLLPIVDFGQEKAWVPQNTARVWAWALTGAGWVLTTALIAGLTNALKRD